MRMITRENIPCWYELSWRPEELAIAVKIHKDFAARAGAEAVPHNALIVKELMREFAFRSFNGSFTGAFGFNEVFVCLGEVGDFIEYLVRLPLTKKATDKRCRECRGSGKNEYDEEGKCIFCDGERREKIYDYEVAYAISATFTLFFQIARHYELSEDVTSSLVPQLLIIETVTMKAMHGGELNGEYSLPLAAWLRSRSPHESLKEMIEAMKAANRRMNYRLTRFEENRFEAYVSATNGWLNVSCPGDACGLHPASDFDINRGLGYQFSSHNVDNPVQQLTLLAGLAALHDTVRKTT